MKLNTYNQNHNELDTISAKVQKAKQLVHVGSKYRHYKSIGMYEVISIGIIEATEEPVVIYQALYGDKLTWIRPIPDFLATVEKDGKPCPRFEEIR